MHNMTNLEYVDLAMAKFPKAKRIAVMNFSIGYNEMSMEASMNLDMDAQMYRWNSDTVKAIKWVINQKALANKVKR